MSCGRLGFASGEARGPDDGALASDANGDLSDASGDAPTARADSSDAATAPDPSLIFWLPFNDSATLLREAVSNTDLPCYSNRCPIVTGSGAATHARFIGSLSTCLSVPSIALFKQTKFTISAHVLQNANSTMAIVSKGLEPDFFGFFTWKLGMGPVTGNPSASFQGSDPMKVVSGLAAPSSLVHIAVTYDDATTTATLYVNGAMQASNNMQARLNYDEGAVMVGCTLGFGTVNDAFDGEMADLRLYSRVLSPAEIANLTP